ncbi:elongation factor 1-beta [Candidatus Woesearchaeota archaeon]|nr:elongation factor 1-beta [Candidatus Woesearchaeota archaeon]
MANIVVTLKIMPKNPKTDLKSLELKAKEHIKKFGGDVGKIELEPIAFGLKAIKLIFVMDEDRGSTESLEDAIKRINGVNSVEVLDVRRAIG